MLVDGRTCWYLFRYCFAVILEEIYGLHFLLELLQFVGICPLALLQITLLFRKPFHLLLEKRGGLLRWPIIELSPLTLVSVDYAC
jgi:hypothetical protein